jgi:hypothetical protein
MIFFKKQKLIVDFFTTRPDVYKYSPIDYAYKFYPHWWKKTPLTYSKTFFERPTIKSCNGIIDTYKKGFIIPLWSDLALQVENKNIFWHYADDISTCDFHDHQQWENYTDINKYYHLKIKSPWIAKCKDNINFYFTKPFWNHSLGVPYEILSGVLNFKYNNSTHIQMMIDIQKNYIYNFKALTPMAHVIPFTDKELIIKNHLVDEHEFKKIGNHRVGAFLNSYAKSMHISKKLENKCPFHFFK